MASTKSIGSAGERAALADLQPAFPHARKINRVDWGVKDIDLVLSIDERLCAEVKTGKEYLSKGYQKHLDQAAGYRAVRPSMRWGALVVQDRPGRGRQRTSHTVFRTRDFVEWAIEQNLEMQQLRDENEFLRRENAALGGGEGA